jgi:hypothetical protein
MLENMLEEVSNPVVFASAPLDTARAVGVEKDKSGGGEEVVKRRKSKGKGTLFTLTRDRDA